ncbi:hypothetical protein CDL15_Pgr023818 [Punica granatum]|uniref:Uncharacterized protein n=1 Tax=Punica granatum TaxID=22663 RepID=A0A218VZA8_PUNGR|nr:hypothetical protein CDL15_Pgr023818 [Punica granatum]
MPISVDEPPAALTSLATRRLVAREPDQSDEIVVLQPQSEATEASPMNTITKGIPAKRNNNRSPTDITMTLAAIP